MQKRYDLRRVGRKGLLFFLLAIAGAGLYAQESDHGSWLSVELSKDLTRKAGLEFEEEIRLFKNLSEIDRFSTSLGVTYSLYKFLKAGAGYAWLYDHDVKDAYWENRHRVYLHLTGKVDWRRFTFSLRERFQSTAYDQNRKGFDYTPRRYLRTRLQAVYDIPGNKAEPYLTAEFHRQLNNPLGNVTDNHRYTAGVDFPLSKKLDLDLFLRFDREVKVKNPGDLWILGGCLKVGL